MYIREEAGDWAEVVSDYLEELEKDTKTDNCGTYSKDCLEWELKIGRPETVEGIDFVYAI